ncbi:methyl-accepting chemotaxis protein [Parasedimentitalea maritima]|nr:methyl-accepting chemotaxis protein [Zongyanglinia marina]
MQKMLKSIAFRLTFPIPLFILLCLGIAWLSIPRILEKNTIDFATTSATGVVNQIKAIRGYYTRNVIKDVKQSADMSAGIDHANDPSVIPLPATFVHDVNALLAEQGTSLSLYSAFPFPGRAEREMDSFMQDAWEYLSANPDGTFKRQEIENGETYLRVAVADPMVAEGCVSCHNAHPDTPKADWEIGDVRGVLEVRENIQAPLLASQILTRNILIGVALAGLALMLIALFTIRTITRPITKICESMDGVAAGELDSDIPSADRKDELGKIGKALASLRDDLKRARGAEEERAEQQREQHDVVEKLSHGLVDLAKGDFSKPLTEPFPADHEQLRSDFNRTLTTLSLTISDVINSADSIRNGATEISQASDDLSQRTESQAATLEQTAAALEEMTTSVKSASEGARSVEGIVNEAKSEAEASGTVVQNAVSAMTEIEDSARHISQIISVIDDIAFQTNLLALNAGVEAARAGEAGRGFAVVASEVRALAQRSSDAAMEIKTLIGDSSKQVEQGVDLVGKAGTALNSIVERVSHISQLVSEMAVGTSEQSTGLGEINLGVTQLDQVTQQNAAMVEEATAASHLLNTDANKLAKLVSHFNIDGNQQAPAEDSIVEFNTPSAHGSDWDMEPETQPLAAAANGDLGSSKVWQDF